MKMTEYFLSASFTWTQGKQALDDVKGKRDEFLKANSIGEIESEKIEFITVNQSNHIYAILSMTYYPKKIK